MYLEQIVKRHVHQAIKALDLCAAPGGKASQLLDVLPETSLLVANEVIRSRASLLTENLTKWGSPYAVVTANDPAEIGRLTSFFDLLLADVPCSGEGMFRKDPTARREWSPSHVRLCAERQKRIIADSWPALIPGGLLIYSTCTYNREENEEVLEWICQKLGADTVESPRRFLPHKTKGEGFCISAVRKATAAAAIPTTNNKTRNSHRPKASRARISITHPHPEAKSCVLQANRFIFNQESDEITALPSLYSADYTVLRDHLNVLLAGLSVGKQKGRDWVPAHSLALSSALAPDRFPRWDVDLPSALRFLRKETPETPTDHLPKGYILITYRDHPLGFTKNIGSRLNNLYPSNWRIRIQ